MSKKNESGVSKKNESVSEKNKSGVSEKNKSGVSGNDVSVKNESGVSGKNKSDVSASKQSGGLRDVARSAVGNWGGGIELLWDILGAVSIVEGRDDELT